MDPTCCPITHSHAPSTNWIAETATALYEIRAGTMSRCCSTLGRGEWGMGILNPDFEGETEAGRADIDWVRKPSSRFSGGVLPGSKNEKKLWERECLWWCPRLEAEEEPECGAVSKSGVRPCDDGGRAPNVKPCPKGVNDWRGLRGPGKLILDPADGIKGASTSTGISSSWASSSLIVPCGLDPGRGKKKDKLRECSLVCLRPFPTWEASGAEWEMETLGGI